MNGYDLICALRYQTMTPRVTTLGNCSRACGRSARGCGVCRHCLTADLSGIVGYALADHLAASLRQA